MDSHEDTVSSPSDRSDQVVSRRAGAPTFVRLDDDFLAIDPNVGRCFNLNATGARIWELLADAPSFGELCLQLSAEYNCQPADLTDDVSELIDRLSEAGLIDLTVRGG